MSARYTLYRENISDINAVKTNKDSLGTDFVSMIKQYTHLTIKTLLIIYF